MEREIRVGNARLLKLAELLEALPRKRFNYAAWVGIDWKGKPDLSCGTMACALGWATTIPAFRRAGLRLDHLYGGEYAEPVDDVTGEFGADAGRRIFGLTQIETRYLFLPDYGTYLAEMIGPSPGATATPKQVAKHIRRFVKFREAGR